MGFPKAPTSEGFGSFGKGGHFFHGSIVILYQIDLTVECIRFKTLSDMEFPAMHPLLCLKNGFYVYLQLLIETELWGFFLNIVNIFYLKPNKGGSSKKLRRLCVVFLKIILHKKTLFKVQIETFLIFFLISLSSLFGTYWIFERQHFFIQRYLRITGTKA